MKIIVQDTSVSRFGVNDIQQARAIRKYVGGLELLILLELTFFRNCFNEVACRDSILSKLHQ
jgi:hypothetical protein